MNKTSRQASALARAAAFDEQGEHDAAINTLAEAAQADDLSAMTALARRLLVGDRAPYLPEPGARFILEAAWKGHAEALSLRAVLQCTGVYQQKSWPQALLSLGASAAAGWQPAREQLLLFASALNLSGQQRPPEDAEDWHALAQRIPEAALFEVPPGQRLSDSPHIEHIEGLIPPDWCDYLIALSGERLKPAKVYDASRGTDFQSETRTNSIAEFPLVDNQLIHFVLQERMSRACGVPMNQMEGTAILNYQPGQQISPHYDFVDPATPHYRDDIARNGQRIITFLIYLNEHYAGGETDFPRLGIRHKGRRGEGLFFSNVTTTGDADTRTLHAGMPPVSGEKWIVSQFIRNRPVHYILKENLY